MVCRNNIGCEAIHCRCALANGKGIFFKLNKLYCNGWFAALSLAVIVSLPLRFSQRIRIKFYFFDSLQNNTPTQIQLTIIHNPPNGVIAPIHLKPSIPNICLNAKK